MFMLDKLRALVKRYLIIFNGKIFWNVYPFSLEHWPDIKCIPFNHFYMEPWPDLKCISLFSGILVIPCWSPNKHQSKWQIICRTVHYMQWLNEILQKKKWHSFHKDISLSQSWRKKPAQHRSTILLICGSPHILILYVHKYLKSSWNQDKNLYFKSFIDPAIVIRLL